MDFYFLPLLISKSSNQKMKIMKNFKTYLLTAVAALMLVTTFTSCDKDEAGVFNPKKKISQIYYKDYDGQEYLSEQWTWDGDLLSKVDYYVDGVLDGSESYEYIDKKLNKVIDTDLYYSLYTYDENDNYSKIEYYDDNGVLVADVTFQYTEDKVSQMSITTYSVTKHFFTMLKRSFIGKMLKAEEMDLVVKEVKKNQINNSKSTTNVVLVYNGDNISTLTVGEYITTFTNYDQFKSPYYYYFPFNNYTGEANPIVFNVNNPGTMTTAFDEVDIVTTYAYTYDGDYPTYVQTTTETFGQSITTTTRLVYLD